MNTELKGLYFADKDQQQRLKDLMTLWNIKDSTSPYFVPLYVMSALPEDILKSLKYEDKPEDSLHVLAENKDPLVKTLAELALALSPENYIVDLSSTFEQLSGTPLFELSLRAIDLRWEIPALYSPDI